MTADTALIRAKVIAKIRAFFSERGVLEIETPILSRGISTDCHIDVFQSEFFPAGYGSLERSSTMYLQTSPELHMKRLLASGYPDLFQICKVFRNGEYGRMHNPEFTMLEWYRRALPMQGLVDEVVALCQDVLGEVPVAHFSYQEAFLKAARIDPLDTPLDELLRCCRVHNLQPPSPDNITDVLQFMMSELVERSLPRDTLSYIVKFPAAQAVLAVIDKDDPRVANRFELFYKGMELANGYEELADPQENARRMEAENGMRRSLGKPELPVDPRFIEALRRGLPCCSGVALGVDRLLLALTGHNDVSDVVSFGWAEA